MLGISILMKSLSAEVKGFLHVDGINWERTFSTISAMSSFAAFVGDFTCFVDKPKTIVVRTTLVRLVVLAIYLGSL